MGQGLGLVSRPLHVIAVWLEPPFHLTAALVGVMTLIRSYLHELNQHRSSKEGILVFASKQASSVLPGTIFIKPHFMPRYASLEALTVERACRNDEM